MLCFEKSGMHFHLYKVWGGRSLCWGRGEEGRFEPCSLLAGGGDRSRRGADPFRLFLSPPTTNPVGKTPKGVTECHTSGHNFQCPNASQLRPGLDTTGGSSHGPGDLSFLATFFFPFSKLALSPPLFYTCSCFPSLSGSSSLPLPVHSTCFQKKTIFRRGGVSP